MLGFYVVIEAIVRLEKDATGSGSCFCSSYYWDYMKHALSSDVTELRKCRHTH